MSGRSGASAALNVGEEYTQERGSVTTPPLSMEDLSVQDLVHRRRLVTLRDVQVRYFYRGVYVRNVKRKTFIILFLDGNFPSVDYKQFPSV